MASKTYQIFSNLVRLQPPSNDHHSRIFAQRFHVHLKDLGVIINGEISHKNGDFSIYTFLYLEKSIYSYLDFSKYKLKNGTTDR